MEIKQVKLDSLKAYEKNPRIISEEAVQKVAESIKEFGFKIPIIADKNNTIVAGHTRKKAAESLGMTEVPVIVADDLTEDQIQAFRLADNKVSEYSEWDLDLLQEEIDNISTDMDRFGFDGMMTELDIEDVEEDEYEEKLPREPKAKYGDIYQLGRHRVMCGDSTIPEDMEKLTDGRKADMVVTDPPYNVAYEGGTAEALTIQNDDMDELKFEQFLTDAFKTMTASLKPGGAFYIWHSESTGHPFIKALEAANLKLRQKLIWVKSSLVIGRQDYHWKHEPCFYGWKDGAAHYFSLDRTQTTVIEDDPKLKAMTKDQLIDYAKELRSLMDAGTTIIREDKPTKSEMHPTMKPVKLIARSVLNSCRPGEIVLDVFGGSGSTLIACEQTDRTAYLMELDPKYVDVIIDRWELLTGQEAVKING